MVVQAGMVGRLVGPTFIQTTPIAYPWSGGGGIEELSSAIVEEVKLPFQSCTT